MDMPSASPQRVTQLLADWRNGNDAALTELTPLIYEDLRGLAHRYELHRICFPAEVKDEVYCLYHGTPAKKSSANISRN